MRPGIPHPQLCEAVSDVFVMAFMLTGRLLAESLRVGAGLEVADLRLVQIGRARRVQLDNSV